MTPGETRNRIDAWQWKERRGYEWGAWMLAHLLSPWSKKALKPSQFLGQENTMSKQQKMDELTQRLEKRAAQQ